VHRHIIWHLKETHVQILNGALFLILFSDLLDLLVDLDFLTLWFDLVKRHTFKRAELYLEKELRVEQVLLLQLIDTLGSTNISEELDNVEGDLP
jgi:hypothetical protein